MTRNVGTMWQQGSEPIDLFFAQTPLLMHSVNAAGTLTRVSDPWASRLGYDAAEMTDRPLTDFLDPASRRKAMDEVLPRLIRTGAIHNVAYDFRHRDGTPVPVTLSSIAHYTADGSFHRSLSFIADGSQVKQAGAISTQKHRFEAIGSLVGGVAHDFNNLLSVVMGNLELLADMPDHPERATMLRDALVATQRGATLTQQLVSYGQRAQLAPRAHRLGDVFDDISEMLARPLPANVALRMDLAPSLPQIMIDRGQLETALFNIVGNACEALDRGGEITVSAQPVAVDENTPLHGDATLEPGRYVAISVRDTGPGMSGEVAERAFDPFFTTKSTRAGSGMGLAMVFGFARQSDGGVHLDTAPGRGTCVTLYLPALRIAAAPPSPPTPPSPKGSRRATGPRPAPVQILLVEDKTDVRRLLATQLRLAGHGVIEASTGDSAMSLINHGLRPQLVLSDVSMPGTLQGPDLVARVHEKLPDVKTVLLSGHVVDPGPVGDTSTRLTKPVSRRALLKCIAEVMAGSPADRDAATDPAKGLAAPASGF